MELVFVEMTAQKQQWNKLKWHFTACRDHLDAGSGGPDVLWNVIPTLFHCCFWAAILRTDSESVRQTLVPLLFPAPQKHPWQWADRFWTA